MTIILWIALLPSSQAAPPADERCPVLPAEKADPRFTRVHGGRTFRFCCERCVREFEESPGRFVSPGSLQGEEAAAGGIRGPVFFPAVLLTGAALCALAGRLFRRRGLWAAAAGMALTGTVAAALTILVDRVVEASRLDGVNLTTVLGLRLYAVAALPGLVAAYLTVREGRIRGVLAALRGRPALTAAGAAAIVVPIVVLGSRFRREVDARAVDIVHFATFEDYGRPPVPKPPARKALGGVWYRGNDERDPRLPNGGNYRTCSFTLRLETSEGRAIAAGESVGSAPLWVSLDIDRPPNTKEGLYSPSIFSRCYLTRASDAFMGSSGPIPDRVPIETVKPLWRWKARYPLGAASGGGLRGIVYVCEEQWMEARTFYLGDARILGGEGFPRTMMAGGRFHYAIQYDLSFEGGRIAGDSGLWMGALYRARKFSVNQLPYHEWLSETPIPVSDSMERNIALPESPDREDR